MMSTVWLMSPILYIREMPGFELRMLLAGMLPT
jgi:hypothetical protein